MSNWNRSDVIAVSSVIVAIIAIIIGTYHPEVRCLIGLQSESCPSPPGNGNPTQIDAKPKNTTGVDYTTLRKLLNAGKWNEADEETWRVILHATGREVEGWLRNGDVLSFPCEDLRNINKLWLQYSKNKFGLSVQKEIYMSLGGNMENFRKQVGWWRPIGTDWWLPNYIGQPDNLTWYLNVNKGALPLLWGFMDGDIGAQGRWDLIFSRAETCNL